ncbi:MAG: DUF1289 domain-containing protein [Leptospira sp.]|nr:DUF1289 domain-containing protein [Leptospira sp.]
MPSPCIKVCFIDPVTRLCEGCFRSLEEIGAWSAYDEAVRDKIMDELPSREILINRD